MNAPLRYSSFLAAAFIATLASSPALYGAVLHSNFAAGDTYDIGSFWTVRGTGGGQSDIDVAAPFTVGATGATLTTAEMALRNFSGLNSMAVLIMNDAGGSPGSPLASATVSGMPTNTFGGIATVDFSSASLALAANTTYWLVADVPAGDNTYVSWFRNLQGEQGAKARFSGGGWLQFFPSVSGAFRINAADPVPEPTGLALAVIALVSMVVAVQRRK